MPSNWILFFDPDIESDDDNDSAIGFDRFQEIDETLRQLSEALRLPKCWLKALSKKSSAAKIIRKFIFHYKKIN